MDTTAAAIELHLSANTASFTRTHVVADSIEVPRLTLRPLKKHTNVRLGKKIDLTGYPSKTSLLAISNKYGWFFVGHEQTIRASPLSELRTFLAQNSTEEEVQFLCQVKLETSPDLPLFITLAAEESKLVVASTSSVSIWDVRSVITGETTLAHTFKLNNLVIVDVLPNPGESPETVAFLTTGHSQDEPCTLLLYNCLAATEIVRWSGLMKQGNAPVSASWSSRGKQIAIGLASGDIVQYSPSSPSEAKTTVPRAQGPDLQGNIPLALQWLSNTTFYVIYAQPRSEDLEEYEPTQYNYIISYDKKTNHAIDTLIPLPWEPYGLQREPGHLVTTLRSWGAFKHLVFVNDAHANDVGIIACLGDPTSPVADDSGRWIKVSLGEESLTFPLSSEMDDTSLVGMAVDLSATQKLLGASQANGDDPVIPPAPILYMMTNDAVIVAFHIVNEDEGQYPAMEASSTNDASMRGGTEQGMDMATDKSQSQTPTAMEPDRPTSTQSQLPSAFGASIPAFGQTGFGFGSAPTAPKFGTTGFGSGAATSPFATAASSTTSPPAFRSSGPTLGFGAFANTKPTFGSSSFGAAPAQSPFGQSPSISNSSSTPAFGASTTPSAFGSSAGSGFSAFAGPKASFGQSTFGTSSTQSAFGSTTASSAAFNTQSAVGAQGSTATPIATASDPALASRNEGASNATPASQAPSNSSAAVSGTATSVFKPSFGFGAFGGGGSFTSNAFSNPKPVAFDGKATAFAGGGVPSASVTPSTAPPTVGPGAPKFGQSTFGQSKFGQSAFGQSSFGASKSAFAPPATYAVSSVPTSGGGFSAFAGSSTSFASLANQTADSNKPAYVEPVNSTDGKVGTLSKDSKPVFGLAKEVPSTEVKKDLPAGKSPFGSNVAVSKIGFGGPLRARTGNEDDEEEGERALKERFPEDEADKLEPEQIFTGPGLFESGGGSKSKANDDAAKGLGQLGLHSAAEEKGKGTQQVGSAFRAVPPLSAAVLPKSLAKNAQDQDSENEVSIELEDDVNEFLSEDDDDDDLEEVDLTGDLEVHEFDDAEEVEDDDEEEEEEEDGDDDDDDDDEEEEEDAASLPDDASGESTPPASKMGSSNKPQPKAVTPSAGSTTTGNVYNPFGRSVGTSKSQSENTDDVRSQASQSPSMPSRSSIRTPTKAADNAAASTSATPLPRPSLAEQLAPPVSQDSPTRPKARPASPKAAFGSWGSSTATTQALQASTGARSSTSGTLPDNKPQGQVTSGKGATPAANSLVNITTPSIAPPSEPQVQAIQPQHPELQNHLDQILINYGILINNINERARKIRGAFDAFKAATAGASPIEGLPEPYRSMSLDRLKLALKEMNETTTALKSKTFILQQGLLDLQGASLRAEMKREEAARYLAARQNPQFMENLVKPRGLGPEHTENRNRLRKSIQLQTDRVKEIDEHVRRLKRKVELFKAGNMSYQPPNLDQVRNACQNIDLYISTANERIAELMIRVDSLPNDRRESIVESQDELHRSRRHPRHLSSSFSVTRAPISRTTSLDITQETIVTTVEVFSGEVKMTKLRDALVHSRSGKPAPLVKSSNRNTRDQVKGGPVETWQPGRNRKDPFSKFKKPIVLKDLPTPKPNSHGSAQLTDVKQASAGGPVALSSPPVIPSVQSQSIALVAAQPELAAPSLAPRISSATDTHRRGGAGPGGSSRHSKAVPINRDRQNMVQDTSFSFGPPPVIASSLKVPDKFVSLTAKKP